MGLPNTDEKTGIKYGIATGAEIPEWFWDDAEPETILACPDCGEDVYDDDQSSCANCGFEPEDVRDWYVEDTAWIINTEDFKARTDLDKTCVFVVFSTRVVNCRECSPCYPLAGNLGEPEEHGFPTYGFPESISTLADLLASSEYDTGRFGSSSDDEHNDPRRWIRVSRAAEFGADGSTHQEVIQDWASCLGSNFGDVSDATRERILAEIMECEKFHDDNGSLFDEIR